MRKINKEQGISMTCIALITQWKSSQKKRGQLNLEELYETEIIVICNVLWYAVSVIRKVFAKGFNESAWKKKEMKKDKTPQWKLCLVPVKGNRQEQR